MKEKQESKNGKKYVVLFAFGILLGLPYDWKFKMDGLLY